VLRRAGTRERRLATLAVGAGIAASIFLLLSAILYWTLTRAEVARELGVAQAVLVLSYLAGGQALAARGGGLHWHDLRRRPANEPPAAVNRPALPEYPCSPSPG
jgi:hypothetical protein